MTVNDYNVTLQVDSSNVGVMIESASSTSVQYCSNTEIKQTSLQLPAEIKQTSIQLPAEIEQTSTQLQVC